MATLIDDAAVPLKEALQYLGFSAQTLHRKIKDGSAPPSYKVGRLRFFPVKSLREWRENLIAAAQSSN
jgi:predicted DNA-binding transcriptional regulator AlpA